MKLSNSTHQAFEQKVVCNNNLLLWTESFGDKANSTVLLSLPLLTH